MKVRMEQLAAGEEEIIIRYREMNERIEALCRFIKGQESKLRGRGLAGAGQVSGFTAQRVFIFGGVTKAF